MKRVESSKEASRNLVVIDPDGTTEWQQVKLNPTDWSVVALIFYFNVLTRAGRGFARRKSMPSVKMRSRLARNTNQRLKDFADCFYPTRVCAW